MFFLGNNIVGCYFFIFSFVRKKEESFFGGFIFVERLSRDVFICSFIYCGSSCLVLVYVKFFGCGVMLDLILE